MTSSDGKPLALTKLHEYATKVKESGYLAAPREGNSTYEARLNDTLQQLQNRVQQHRVALAKVSSGSCPLRKSEVERPL